MTPAFPKVELCPTIFRAYDIRGEVDKNLTPAVAYWLGRAFAAQLIEQQQSCLNLAWDGRLSSPELANAFQQGALEAGISVNSLGAQPTGLLYFAGYFLDCPNGVMITGSHNPIQYNGFKPVIKQLALSADEIQQLYQRIQQQQLPRRAPQGQLRTLNISADYLARLTTDIKIKRPLKVVVDAGNGIAGPLAVRLMEQLGIEAEFLYCDVDGRFPNHHPDPGVEKNLEDLRQRVLATQADLGLAFDGDGDRVGLVDSQANIIWPDRLLMLLCTQVLPQHPNALVIYDVKSTQHVAALVEQLGGQALMTPTGHSIMKRIMQQEKALLGGEFSGHLYLQDRWFGFDDGLYAAARLLEVLSQYSESSTEVFAKLANEVSTPELSVTVSEHEKFSLIEQLQQDLEFLAGAKVFSVDGLRLEFSNGWGLIRASNTTPKLTLRFAGQSTEAIAAIQQHFQQALQRILPNSSEIF